MNEWMRSHERIEGLKRELLDVDKRIDANAQLVSRMIEERRSAGQVQVQHNFVRTLQRHRASILKHLQSAEISEAEAYKRRNGWT